MGKVEKKGTEERVERDFQRLKSHPEGRTKKGDFSLPDDWQPQDEVIKKLWGSLAWLGTAESFREEKQNEDSSPYGN